MQNKKNGIGHNGKKAGIEPPESAKKREKERESANETPRAGQADVPTDSESTEETGLADPRAVPLTPDILKSKGATRSAESEYVSPSAPLDEKPKVKPPKKAKEIKPA